jgi:hypothetical protein
MIRTKHQIVLVVVLIASAGAVFSQPPQPYLVDELRTGGTNCEEGFARLDSFFNELSNDPASSGVIVVYGDTADRKAASRRERQLRNHVQLRRFDRSRITFIRGDGRENGTTQFWLVRPGAERPEVPGGIIADSIPLTAAGETLLYAADYIDGVPGCSGNLYDLEEFASVLRSNPGMTARIVISESSQPKYRRRSRAVIAELTGHGIARNRIVTAYKYVRAGRLLEVTELWLIPAKRQVGLIVDEIEEVQPLHRCPSGGLAWLRRC